MTYIAPLLLIAGIYLAVLASPGPNFFILSQMALDGRQRQARYVVLGLCTGSVFWVSVSLAGLASLLAHHPWLEWAVQLLGASYLVWYGWGLLRRAFAAGRRATQPAPARDTAATTRWSAYRAGLMTAMTNPKSAAFWTGAFAALVPAQASRWFHVATIALVAALSLAWHLGITIVFSSAALRARYLRLERWVDGLAGGMLVTLGLQRIVAR